MEVPSPWIAILLMLGSYRIWKLLAEDQILNWPRNFVVGLPLNWEEDDPIPAHYRFELARFISCIWCFGWWIVLSVWILWQLEPKWTAIFAVPFAMSAAAGFARTKLDPVE